MIADTGAGLYAGKALVDLFGLEQDEVHPPGSKEIVTVGELDGPAAGSQLNLTFYRWTTSFVDHKGEIPSKSPSVITCCMPINQSMKGRRYRAYAMELFVVSLASCVAFYARRFLSATICPPMACPWN